MIILLSHFKDIIFISTMISHNKNYYKHIIGLVLFLDGTTYPKD